MSTTLTNAAAEVSRLKTEIKTHESTFPNYLRRSSDIEYGLKKKHYDAKLANLQSQLDHAEIVHQHAEYAKNHQNLTIPKEARNHANHTIPRNHTNPRNLILLIKGPKGLDVSNTHTKLHIP